jgi:hypothetical protein
MAPRPAVPPEDPTTAAGATAGEAPGFAVLAGAPEDPIAPVPQPDSAAATSTDPAAARSFPLEGIRQG